MVTAINECGACNRRQRADLNVELSHTGQWLDGRCRRSLGHGVIVRFLSSPANRRLVRYEQLISEDKFQERTGWIYFSLSSFLLKVRDSSRSVGVVRKSSRWWMESAINVQITRIIYY